jgi:RNA polymerase sigma factor (sigma-70 family)
MRDEDFSRLFDEHAEALFAYVAYRSGDRSMAEDVVGAAFERAYKARRRFNRRRGSERAWLYAIARNLMLDEIRRRDAERRAVERERSGARHSVGGIEAVEAQHDVQTALAALSEEEREAIALRFGADLTVPEIAEMTKLPLTTVEGRVYRALGKMRDHLEGDQA